MSVELYTAYLIGCFAVAIVPGPTATLIIANGLRHGTRAGLLNVAGTQLGLAAMIAIVGIGLASAIEMMGHWLVWLRLVGAAYLIWLGWRMVRASPAPEDAARVSAARGGFFKQGCLVALSNPKALFFFGAFLPQFVDPARGYALQIVVLGATAMICAAIGDGAYAVLSGHARRALSRRHLRALSCAGGGFLIGGGLWLAFSGTR